jgi:hypothetical protein
MKLSVEQQRKIQELKRRILYTKSKKEKDRLK